MEDPCSPQGLALRRDVDVVRFHHCGAGAHDVRQWPAVADHGRSDAACILPDVSFTYFPNFQSYDFASEATAKPGNDGDLRVSGFAVGNPNGYQNFIWNSNFGMTAFMTPVNEQFNPLPTRVLYVWKADQEYSVYSDRAQNTLMMSTYNPGQMVAQEALLTRPGPYGVVPPPNSATGFLINFESDGSSTCIGGSQFPFPQEPPTWVSIPRSRRRSRRRLRTTPSSPRTRPSRSSRCYSRLRRQTTRKRPTCGRGTRRRTRQGRRAGPSRSCSRSRG